MPDFLPSSKSANLSLPARQRRENFWFAKSITSGSPSFLFPAFVLDISDQWDAKFAAIRCFESQFITGRPTESPTFLEGLRDEAAYWGKTIGCRYGEPFTCREPLGMKTMAGLV